jgi:hypothetical protein
MAFSTFSDAFLPYFAMFHTSFESPCRNSPGLQEKTTDTSLSDHSRQSLISSTAELFVAKQMPTEQS